MFRNRFLACMLVFFPLFWYAETASAGRGGFGGGRGGGRGMGGGMSRGGMGGGRGMGGMGGGMSRGGMGMGGMSRGGMGMSSMGHTPSFGSPMGGASMRGSQRMNNPYAGGRSFSGAQGGQARSGARSGSYTTRRGTDINYGAAGAGGVGPNGGAAGRGAAGVQATTPGGRTLTDVGRAAGVAGPNGGAVGIRSNTTVATGPNGVVAGRERGVAGWRNPAYADFNNRWVHGYWGGHYNGWGWRGYGYPYGGWGAYGLGAMTALSAWGLGSALYSGGWGYMPYYNPYYYAQPAVATAAPVYDYSSPIDTAASAPSEDVSDQAAGLFDQARAAFKGGDYTQALGLTDQALKLMPENSAIHEFRALTLFALGRYDDAAGTLYGVLAVGPGWDWTTLLGLYPDVDVFASQQKALEDYVRANPNSASARFYLAYIYLTEGHNEAAMAQLGHCVELQPKDQVSARLLQSMKAAQPAQAQAPQDGNPEPAPTSSPEKPASTLAGQWTARPSPDSTISFSAQDDGTFSWTVNAKGQNHTLKGKSSYVDGVLTLVQDGQSAPLVGRVTWSDADNFVFQALGGGPDDPGLSFHKGS